MTTAARKLKTFIVERRAAHVHYPLTHLGQFPAARDQGEILVTAPSKRAALDRLASLGFTRNNPGHLSLCEGNSAHALIDAGWLAEDGDVVVFRSDVRGLPIVAVPAAAVVTGQAEVVGEWTLLGDSLGMRPMAARRLSDGALFPERRSADPATPATGWTTDMELYRR